MIHVKKQTRHNFDMSKSRRVTILTCQKIAINWQAEKHGNAVRPLYSVFPITEKYAHAKTMHATISTTKD